MQAYDKLDNSVRAIKRKEKEKAGGVSTTAAGCRVDIMCTLMSHISLGPSGHPVLRAPHVLQAAAELAARIAAGEVPALNLM